MNGGTHFGLVIGVCLSTCFAGVSQAEPESGLSAIQSFIQWEGQDEAPEIYGAVGFFADPTPPQWLVLTPVEGEEDVFRECIVKDGVVTTERMFRKLPGQDLPSIPIRLEDVKYDSGDAFLAAEEAAGSRKIKFESAHFQLRCREKGQEPVWMVSLLSGYHISIGVVYVSAKSGDVIREKWQGEPSGKMYSSTIELSKPVSGN